MLISRERTKLINAIVFFARNTQKLFKLLYLLDFEHFRQTGRSVTGMDYRAWQMGPVPLPLMQEWDQLAADLAAAIDIVPERVIDYERERVVPKAEFDDSAFTKRELRLMAELADRFRTELTRPLINFTHAERGPWEKIWEDGRGNNARIPFLLAIPDNDPTAMRFSRRPGSMRACEATGRRRTDSGSLARPHTWVPGCLLYLPAFNTRESQSPC